MSASRVGTGFTLIVNCCVSPTHPLSDFGVATKIADCGIVSVFIPENAAIFVEPEDPKPKPIETLLLVQSVIVPAGLEVKLIAVVDSPAQIV